MFFKHVDVQNDMALRLGPPQVTGPSRHLFACCPTQPPPRFAGSMETTGWTEPGLTLSRVQNFKKSILDAIVSQINAE